MVPTTRLPLLLMVVFLLPACTRRQKTAPSATGNTMRQPVPTLEPAPTMGAMSGMDAPAGMDSGPRPMALRGLPTVGRWRCVQDSDCSNSCALGAVNAKWYRTWRPRIHECKGGCSSKGMKARCLQNECVSFGRNNQRASSCTRKAAPANAFDKNAPVPDRFAE